MNEVLEAIIITLYCTFIVWWIFDLSKRITKKWNRMYKDWGKK